MTMAGSMAWIMAAVQDEIKAPLVTDAEITKVTVTALVVVGVI